MTALKRDKPAPPFAYFPRAVLRNPPTDQLSPLELALAAGILRAARTRWRELDHEAAKREGSRAIEAELDLADKYEDDWKRVKLERKKHPDTPAPKRRHSFKLDYNWETAKTGHHGQAPLSPERSFRRGASLREAGSRTYKRTRIRLRRKAAPEKLEVTIFRSALLNAACLSDDSATIAALPSLLDRLTQPACESLPPLLASFKRTPTGYLKLVVNGEWLPSSKYSHVPLPFPTRSLTATALLFFLFGLRNTKGSKAGSIAFDELFQRIGIEATLPRWRKQQALDRALNVVNRYLARLRPQEFSRYDIDMPGLFALEPVENRARFIAKDAPPGYRFAKARTKTKNKRRRLAIAAPAKTHERIRLPRLRKFGEPEAPHLIEPSLDEV